MGGHGLWRDQNPDEHSTQSRGGAHSGSRAGTYREREEEKQRKITLLKLREQRISGRRD